MNVTITTYLSERVYRYAPGLPDYLIIFLLFS